MAALEKAGHCRGSPVKEEGLTAGLSSIIANNIRRVARL
jgi:hypothetical protein